MYTVTTPKTEKELAAYYHFRWLCLREPWGYPEGSEKDEYESVSEHRIIIGSDNKIIGCGRVHLNTSEEAQIRHIAVDNTYRRKGVGKIIIDTLEDVAREMGAERAVSNARESSIPFFSACGFMIQEDAPTELGSLKRKMVVKYLADNHVLILHPKWCAELQNTWHERIPISEHMGILLHQYTERTIETRASLNKNINLHGTMFAGSIYSLATLTGWGMLFLQMKQKGLSGEIVLGDANIHYHKPVTMKPRAVCDIESVDAKFDFLRNGKKCPASLNVNIFDNEDAVAEFTAQYWILPSKQN
ncbi:bifunctional GNAT family N-acetyltransferase/hotdog fold thioesterase [Glaciecola petra]|uniref:Bifunctional GNAT family N-acetyltransferase/hotdog fold thioesterase n=1 Tax=Glaciecola petra TaxID=3075602 RepID=A0ABU2ZVK3_9ALTE|nr:bifunctional GNAT family N-acetyltransferase/hotdog fold thioesterase [Aestuariibacter sp. P117]MDT0595447.1 bifunctional GNAT family N-acetyltransferase/hotdog fold thioesterase [Aestuariibacter sp. P117]